MILTIIGVVFLLIALAIAILGGNGGEKAASLIPALIGVAVLFFASFTIVKPAEVGVPISFGHLGTPVQPGAHMLAPWTKVETYPTRPLTIDDITVTARTKQAGQIKVTVAARWHVDPEHAADLYKQVRTGDEDKISHQVIDRNLSQAVGTVYNALENGPAVNDRAGATTAIRAELGQLLTPYGIALDDVYIRAAEPDDKTADSLARLAAQERETQIAKERQDTAAAEAQARLIEARGLETAAAAIPRDLTPQQVQALCLQAWERMVKAGISAGVPVYTTCDGSGVTPVAPVTAKR